MSYITINGKLLDERDDAIRILVEPNWYVWIPRSTINPKGGLRIKRGPVRNVSADMAPQPVVDPVMVSADVASWKVQQLIKAMELPALHASPEQKLRNAEEAPDDLEATDERFKRMGQEKT